MDQQHASLRALAIAVAVATVTGTAHRMIVGSGHPSGLGFVAATSFKVNLFLSLVGALAGLLGRPGPGATWTARVALGLLILGTLIGHPAGPYWGQVLLNGDPQAWLFYLSVPLLAGALSANMKGGRSLASSV